MSINPERAQLATLGARSPSAPSAQDGAPVGELDLDAIEARANAASRGPWKHGEGYEQGDPGDYVSTAWGGIVVCGDTPPTPADAIFIAHARTDVPALVKRVRELEAQVSAPPHAPPSAPTIDHTRAQVAALGAHGERVTATPADAPAGRFDHAVYGDGLALAYKIGAHGERVFRTG